MTAQDVVAYVGKQWMLHGDAMRGWVIDHRMTLLLVLALLILWWVRREKRLEKL